METLQKKKKKKSFAILFDNVYIVYIVAACPLVLFVQVHYY